MVFELRDTNIEMANRITESYRNNPHLCLVTVGTGGGKTYGAIHTLASYYSNALLIVFTTTKVKDTRQWEKSIADYNSVMGTEILLYISNYEGTRVDKQKETLNQLLDYVSSLNRPIFLVLDEVHKIKLSTDGKLSQQAENIMTLSSHPKIISTLALSATLLSNSYLDLVPYLIMARYYDSQRQFIKRHIKFYDDYWRPVVKDESKRIRKDYFKDPHIIEQYLSQIVVYIETDHLKPDVSSQFINITLTPSEKKRYNTIKEDFKKGVYEFPVQARMAQENMLATELSGQKNRLLIHLLKLREDGYFDNKKTPILIFYQYKIVKKYLSALLKALYPDYDQRHISGGVKLSEEDMNEPKNPNTFCLIQCESGGEGLDWQWSNLAIFYESPVKNEKFNQAKGRNVRNKKIMPHVYHYYLNYKNTVDSQRWLTNKYKQDFTDDIADRLFYDERETI